jgi:hypothetical protein
MANIRSRVKKLEERAAPRRVLTLSGPADASVEEINERVRQTFPDRTKNDLVVYIKVF